jgi:asparagine synthase (glutamine-hydrolysing)
MKNKFILKELATRYLGSEYVYRPKEGFGIPVSQWLREDRDNYLKDSLLNNQANIYSYLDREMINNMVTSHLSGSQDYGTKLWNILMLDGWINQVDRK